jgi:ATP-dependent DNA helicase RecG
LRERLLVRPLRYEDRRFPQPARHVDPGTTALLLGEIVQVRSQSRFLKVVLRDLCDLGSAQFQATFFHYRRWHTDLLTPGAAFAFLGKVGSFQGTVDLQQPAILDRTEIGMILPIYRRRGKLGTADIRAEILGVLAGASDADLASITSPWVREALAQHGTLPIPQAVRTIHDPEDPRVLARAQETLARMEILERVEATLRLREARQQTPGVQVHVSADEMARFAAELPFALSPGQQAALESVREKLASPYPAKILLMGGVASGKTAICHIAARATVYGAREGRNKVLIVAPTQILCQQLFSTFSTYFPAVRAHLVVGAKGKKKALPEADVYFGTHGLFNRGLDWSRVGTVIFDEEHRFGAQVKFGTVPMEANRIFMSATPIPRSLSLYLFGDMDLVRIAGRPHDRRVVTRVLTRDEGREALAAVRDTLAAGRKAIVVYGAIRREEEPTAVDWERAYFLASFFPGDRVLPLDGVTDLRSAWEWARMHDPDELQRFYRINRQFSSARILRPGDGSPPPPFPILAYDSDSPDSLFVLPRSALLTVDAKGRRKAKAWDVLVDEIRAGFYESRPLVRESLYRAGSDLEKAVGVWERHFPGQVEVVHGRMNAAQKAAAIEAFASGAKPLIVATSIVEVGIDVKGVDCLVLANADRFGTASLVQLRGRVGRSGEAGLCLLVCPSDTGSDYQRLQAFAEETDDLRLAEMDFRERGWGQVRGKAQSGSETVFFDLRKHGRLLEEIGRDS